MRLINFFNKTMIICIVCMMFISSVPVDAAKKKNRDIGSLDDFTVTTSFKKASSPRMKNYKNREAVINLSKDDGCAWIEWKVLDERDRKCCTGALQRGDRDTKEYKPGSAVEGTKYKIYLKRQFFKKKTDSSTIVEGDWCPDDKK